MPVSNARVMDGAVVILRRFLEINYEVKRRFHLEGAPLVELSSMWQTHEQAMASFTPGAYRYNCLNEQ